MSYSRLIGYSEWTEKTEWRVRICEIWGFHGSEDRSRGFMDCSSVKTKAEQSSETAVSNHYTTLRNNSESHD
jgi:hypothetical protein